MIYGETYTACDDPLSRKSPPRAVSTARRSQMINEIACDDRLISWNDSRARDTCDLINTYLPFQFEILHEIH